MSYICSKIKLLAAKKRWRKRNAHNATRLGNRTFDFNNITVGNYSYGTINISTSCRSPRLRIGSFCSIAEGVTFITEDDHPLNTFSTFPFKVMVLGVDEPEALSKGGIILEDDVWIGHGATILDGVTVHRGGVVAAGAVVSKDVEPYTIVGGVPARPLKKRFDNETISRLSQFDYSSVDRLFIEKNLDLLYSPLVGDTIEVLLNDIRSGDEL
ncbi:CatB-related O-acetyltransferase [Collinsella sp. HCP28S3_E12]|uniref:CatB-related O-acetyltransferase n=1 Tax=Collinsella sp. HCP28S3_E12 TaxID=3438921 RepID=UPI003F8AABDC